MRGFPLIGALIVLAVFAVSWPVLQATIGDGVEPAAVEAAVEKAETIGAEATENKLVAIRVIASTEITRLRIDFLGEPLTDGKPAQAEFEKQLVDFAFPREGVDFWIEAEFGENAQTSASAAAIALRLEVEDADGEVYQKTLWSDADSSIADSVFISAFQEEGNQ